MHFSGGFLSRDAGWQMFVNQRTSNSTLALSEDCIR